VATYRALPKPLPTVVGRVLRRGRLSDIPGKPSHFTFHVADSSGTIPVTVWNAYARRYHPIIVPGRIVFIDDYKVKLHGVTRETELSVNPAKPQGMIRVVADEARQCAAAELPGMGYQVPCWLSTFGGLLVGLGDACMLSGYRFFFVLLSCFSLLLCGQLLMCACGWLVGWLVGFSFTDAHSQRRFCVLCVEIL
jgi:hypothetical protein